MYFVHTCVLEELYLLFIILCPITFFTNTVVILKLELISAFLTQVCHEEDVNHYTTNSNK